MIEVRISVLILKLYLNTSQTFFSQTCYTQTQESILILIYNTFLNRIQHKIDPMLQDALQNSEIIQQLRKEIQQEDEFNNVFKKITEIQTLQQLSVFFGQFYRRSQAEAKAGKLFKELAKLRQNKTSALGQLRKQFTSQGQYLKARKKIEGLQTEEQIAQFLFAHDFESKKGAKARGKRILIELGKDKNSLSESKNDISITKELAKQQVGNKPFRIQKKKASKMESKIRQNPQDVKVCSAMEQLAKQFEIDSQYQQFKIKIQGAMLLEEIEDILVPLIGKKARIFARRIFQELGKDKINTSRLDYFFRKIKLLSLNPVDITKIQKLVQQGKKKSVLRMLVEKLGSTGGPKVFNQFQDDIPQIIAKPVYGSKFVRKENGLEIFSYDQEIRPIDKENAKTMIAFGETGCGKSTFLNSVANYITGIQLEDPFRYNIIVQNVSHQTGSITSKITDYYIKNKSTGIVYRLVDTPGFGDTRGISMDEQIIKMVGDKFRKQLDAIHSVLFVIKSSSIRVNQYQKYIFQSIMDLFNKDIAPNFVFIFTFSDCGQPQILNSVKCPRFGFGNYWNQISQPKYLPVNNCGIFQKQTPQKKMIADYWKMGMNCITELFKKVDKIQPKSLRLSKDLINKKEALANKIQHTHQTIQRAIIKRENVKAQIQKIIEYSTQIDSNKNYTYQIPVQVWQQKHVDSNVTRCVNCANSNCHTGCRYGDGEDKQNCCAFTDGYCTICPKKCQWRAHKNQNYIMNVKQVMQTRTNEDNKRKFDMNNQNMNNSQAYLQKLLIQLEGQMQVILNSSEQMTKLQEQLIKNQMSNCKPESTIGYLQYLIRVEQKNKPSGYQKKISGYNDAINQLKLMENFGKGGQMAKKQMIRKINGENLVNILKTVKKPGMFDRFKDFFLS